MRGKRTLPMRLVIAALVAVVVGALAATGLWTQAGRAAAAPPQKCEAAGLAAAAGLPDKLVSDTKPANTGQQYTTPNVVPLNSIDKSKLNLIEPGTITVGTLGDAPPSICIDSKGVYTGFDNELLKAVAAKLGLKIKFVGTDFSGLLAQVANRRFDVGSSSISTTEERRKTVAFTNGYDFGFFSLVTKAGSKITGFDQLTKSTRIGVVQGTVQDDYVTKTLKIDPVRFPDYNTAYANLRSGLIDAWVAPSQQAIGQVKPGEAQIVQNTYSLDSFTAWAVAKGNQPLVDALNSGLDAIIDDGTYAKQYIAWEPRATPEGWKPGSLAATPPQFPDFTAIAAQNARNQGPQQEVKPRSTLQQLSDTFFDWSLYRSAFPDLFKTGLPNTLILALVSAVVGSIIGMVLAIMGISRKWWVRLPARIYTDIFRGLPAVVIILVIGLGIGPVVSNITNNNPYWLGAAALSLLAAAYIGEIFRSGIQSVAPGQLEAARAIGFSYGRSMSLVVIPQGVRNVLPALMNEFISLIKNSSLIYFLGLLSSQRELFAVGKDLNGQTGNLSPLVAAGLVYLLLTIPLTHIVNYFDRRMRSGKA